MASIDSLSYDTASIMSPTTITHSVTPSATASPSAKPTTFNLDDLKDIFSPTSSQGPHASNHSTGQPSLLGSDEVQQAQNSSSDPALLITAIVVGTLSFVLIAVAACFARRYFQQRSVAKAAQGPSVQGGLVGGAIGANKEYTASKASSITTDGSHLERGTGGHEPQSLAMMHDIPLQDDPVAAVPPPVPRKDIVQNMRELCQRPLPSIRVSTRFRPFSTATASKSTATKRASLVAVEQPGSVPMMSEAARPSAGELDGKVEEGSTSTAQRSPQDQEQSAETGTDAVPAPVSPVAVSAEHQHREEGETLSPSVYHAEKRA